MTKRPTSFRDFFRRSALTAIVTLITASAASAQIAPISQIRSVLGDSNVAGISGHQQDIDQIQAPDFDPFAENLITSAANPQASTVVEATQSSTITPCRLAASGGFISDVVVTQTDHSGYGVGIADYRVTFHLSRPSPFRIFARLEADDSTHVRLVLQNASSAIVNILAADQVIDIARQGTLGAGQYTFSFNATGTAAVSIEVGTDHAAGFFDGFLTVCFTPADLNGDDVVNVTDLLGVISAWGSCAEPATCLADLNGDNTVNVTDLLSVISSWG